MSDAGERNHEATPLRLQQARTNGNIPKSAELAASLSMLGAIGAGYLTFGRSVAPFYGDNRVGHDCGALASNRSSVDARQSRTSDDESWLGEMETEVWIV